MNLILIGNDIDDTAKKIWTANTNYTILNKSPYLWNSMFDKFIEDKDFIVCTTSEQFKDKTINDTIDLFEKHNAIPIFIADNKDSFERTMHSAVEELLPNSVLYTKNKENKDFDVLIKLAQSYLLGKGLINDKTLRTPRKRKKSTSKK